MEIKIDKAVIVLAEASALLDEDVAANARHDCYTPPLRYVLSLPTLLARGCSAHRWASGYRHREGRK
jgi:hypothetical protein